MNANGKKPWRQFTAALKYQVLREARQTGTPVSQRDANQHTYEYPHGDEYTNPTNGHQHADQYSNGHANADTNYFWVITWWSSSSIRNLPCIARAPFWVVA
jgi:hypothetical protein